MKYFDEIKKSMEYLAKKKNTVFRTGSMCTWNSNV